MKNLIGLLFFILNLACFSQGSTHSVYLIGDAGEDTTSGPALLSLKEQLINDSSSTVLFLGDNVYPNGLRKESRESQLHLLSQLRILDNYKGNVFFIPGNHDWDAQRKTGLRILKDQELYVNDYVRTKTKAGNRDKPVFLPADGLPGPASVMLDEKLRVIFIDTQWFLHFYGKNTIVSKKHTKELFYKKLDSLLSVARINEEHVVLAAHHPLFSNGQHSRAKQPWRFLVNRTPFQIFGLLGINRLYSQDIAQPRYQKMRKDLLQAMDGYENITFVSGHDHNLQCFIKDGKRFVVSGAGSKVSGLRRRSRFQYAFQDDRKTGFVKLQYSGGKSTTTIFRSGEKPLLLEGF